MQRKEVYLMKNLVKRWLAVMTAAVMCVSMLSVNAFAAEGALTCGKEEHKHTGTACGPATNRTCTQEEHTHDDSCTRPWSRSPR